MFKLSPNVLAAPFAVWLLTIGYMAWKVDVNYAPVGIIPFTALVAFFVWRKPLSLWWYGKSTPELDKPVVRLLEEQHAFYRSLSAADREEFRRKVVLYAVNKEFQGMGFDSIPNDVKAAVSIQAATLSVRSGNFMDDGIENIILYRHPFPSPQQNKLHTCEYYAEDGALLFSVPHMMGGVLQPRAYYDICLHTYAQVFRNKHKQINYPQIDESIWQKAGLITKMRKADILNVTGLQDTDLFRWSLAVVLYVHFNKLMELHLPEYHADLNDIFSPLKSVKALDS